MQPFARADGPALRAVRVRRRSRRRARDRDDGIGRRNGRTRPSSYLTARGEKVGVLKVRLYRPFARSAFLAALPRSVRSLAVLDRTKEPGATGDPLYLDVIDRARRSAGRGRLALRRPAARHRRPLRAVVEGVHAGDGQGGLRRDRARTRPKRHFTVGIVDDVTHTSLPWDPSFRTEAADVSASVFYGLGADGTVGANKNSIKIIGAGNGSLRAGLLRLRLEEVGRDHRLASAHEHAADPLGVPRRSRRASSPATSSSSWTRSTCSNTRRRARRFC